MAEEILASVQVRRDSKANWEAVNPILLDGEAAYEKDTDMFKIGDGVNNYKNLPYHNKVGPKGDTGATPQISMSVSTGAAGSEASVSVSGTAENPLISLTIPRGDTGASGVTEETDPTVPDWAKQPSKPTYTASEVGARPDTWTPSADDVGADAAGTASGAVAAHNTSGAAHADLRALIEGLNSRLNALADSDDTTLDQMSEIVSYIKNNKSLIDGITTGKISTSDIVDNLTTNISNKVLSAAQGVKLKALVDNIIIPSVLPNPYALTINGKSYDGSAAVNITITGGDGGANIDDTTPSTTTTYSSQKIEDQLSALNDANAALIEVSKTEPNTENTELWIHPNADEVQLPQINDSVESEQDTWSSKKIAAEISNKANEKDLAAVAKSGSYNDLTNKPTIPTVPTTLPNPNKLTFTGAVTAEYDGSAEVSVEIPSGGDYELPIASATQLGGVMPVAKTDGMTQAVGVDEAGGLFTVPGSGGGGDETLTVFDITLEADASTISQLIPADISAKIKASNIKSWSVVYKLAATTDESVTGAGSLGISIGRQGLSNTYDFSDVSAGSDAVPACGGSSVWGYLAYEFYQPQKVFASMIGSNRGRYKYYFTKTSNAYQGNAGSNDNKLCRTLDASSYFCITTGTVFGAGSRFVASVVIGGE